MNCLLFCCRNLDLTDSKIMTQEIQYCLTNANQDNCCSKQMYYQTIDIFDIDMSQAQIFRAAEKIVGTGKNAGPLYITGTAIGFLAIIHNLK